MTKNCLKKIGAWLIATVGMVGLLVAVGLGTRSAFALSPSLEGKINASSIMTCIEAGVFKEEVKLSDLKSKSETEYAVSDFMTNNKFAQPFVTASLVKQVASGNFPWYYLALDGDHVSCEFFIAQLLRNRNTEVPNRSDDVNVVTEFMENMGYKKTSADGTDGEGECVHYEYKLSDINTNTNEVNTVGTGYTSSVCAELNDDGTIKSITTKEGADKLMVNISVTSDFGGGARVDISCKVGGLGLINTGSVWLELNQTRWGETSKNTDKDSFLNRLEESILDKCNKPLSRNLTSQGGWVQGELILKDGGLEPVVQRSATTEAIYELRPAEEAAGVMTWFLTGTSYMKRPRIMNYEKFVLYQDYLVNFYEVDTNCNWTHDEAAAYGGDKYREVKLFIGSDLASGEIKTCYVKATKNGNESVGGVNDSTQVFGLQACDFKCVTDWLNESTVEKSQLQELPPQPAGVTSGESGDGSSGTTITTDDGQPIVDCDKFENIGAMQWVLCPTMNNSQYTANLLDQVTEKWLSIDTDIYGSNTATAQIWGTIRNIADVLLVVFFSVVIISQLTGYGIDNYGIKKMLPRIIVMAIIINISLYICQMAIDLSNILGIGLRDLFGGIGNEINSVNGADGLTFIGGMITAAFASAGGISMGAGVATTIVTLGAPIVVGILIAVIVALLVIIVAIFVLFLMLGVRKMIVIICVVLSPLAFAAFILPNTQGLFRKWWDLFKAALIIFPICGAASGISHLLKSMASSDKDVAGTLGIAGAIVMMVLPYAVFFLIPTLLKNAIAALGKVGGALTALGQTVRNGGRQLGQTAWNTAQKTEGFKNLQAEAARKRQSQSAQRTIDRLQRIRDEGGTLNERDTRRLARAHEVQRRLDAENTAARTILTEQEYTGKSQDALVSDWNKAFDAGDTEKMDALTNVITSRHGPGGVNAIAKSLAGKQIFDESTGQFVGGDGGSMARSFNALQSNMMQNSSLSNAMQNKASDVFQMISSGGYVTRNAVGTDGKVIMEDVLDANGNVMRDANGNAMQKAKTISGRANVTTHAANNSIATQFKDWATQSTATLERAVTNGALSQQTAAQILQSTDPTIQSGIQSDADKRMVLQAAAAGYRGDFTNKNAVEEASQQYQKMDHEYIGKTAADVYNEAVRENLARTIGVDSEYANKSADDVYDEAMRANQEFDVREQERATRQAQAENIREIRNSLGQMTGGQTGGTNQTGNTRQNGGDNNSGQGFEGGAGI